MVVGQLLQGRQYIGDVNTALLICQVRIVDNGKMCPIGERLQRKLIPVKPIAFEGKKESAIFGQSAVGEHSGILFVCFVKLVEFHILLYKKVPLRTTGLWYFNLNCKSFFKDHWGFPNESWRNGIQGRSQLRVRRGNVVLLG